MGSILTGAIVERIARTLFDDADNVRWTEDELRQSISDGQRQIVQLVPEANPKNEVVPLIAGSRQRIPDRVTEPYDAAPHNTLPIGFQLLDVLRNMGPDRQTPGRVVRKIARSLLDRDDPMWHSAEADSMVAEYVYDTKDRYHFYVSPPQPANNQGSVEIIYSATPAEITSNTTPIEIDDTYEPALWHYGMYRALTKDLPGEENVPQVAETHYRLFATPLLGKAEVDALLFPLQQMQREKS